MNVSVRRLPLLILLAAALFSVQPTHAQSVATNPVGYNVFALPEGNSLRVNTFVQPTAYQSTAASYTSASNSVVTVSSSGSTLTSGSFNATGTGPAFYMEILSSGSSQGLIVDVVSNDSSTITVNANLASFGVSGTTSFCVRPHTTLASLFPPGCGLSANQDLLKLYFPDGSHQIFSFTGSGDGWANLSLGFTDGGGQIIYPGEGFVVTTSGSENVTVTGCVKPGPTIVPLYQKTANVVGAINPVLSGTQTLATFNFPASLAAESDLVKVVYDDGSFARNGGPYESDGTQMTDIFGTPSNSLLVNPSNAVIISTSTNEYYTMPSFYTSGN